MIDSYKLGRGITRKALPSAAFWGRPLRMAAGLCMGLALGWSFLAHDWTDFALALGLTFTAFASIVQHFEISENDLEF